MLRRLAEDAGLTSPSLVLKRLIAGSPWTHVAGRRPLYPASMIKVPLAAAILASGLPLESTAAVSQPNMTVNDLDSPLVPGYEASIAELLELMITRSDNVATNVLIDRLGRDHATALVRLLGLRRTAIRRKLSGALPLIDDPEATGRNSHPAADAAALFAAIAQRAIPGAALLLEMLGRQRWNEKLARGLQPGDRFCHKTGDTDEVTHDGGILETAQGRRYVLVVYTALPSSPQGDARFVQFMDALRPLL